MSKAFINTMTGLVAAGSITKSIRDSYRSIRFIEEQTNKVLLTIDNIVKKWPQYSSQMSAYKKKIDEAFIKWSKANINEDYMQGSELINLALNKLNEIYSKVNQPRKGWINDLMNELTILNDSFDRLVKEETLEEDNKVKEQLKRIIEDKGVKIVKP